MHFVFKTGAQLTRGFARARHWLDVEAVEISLPALDPAFDGYRIAQFSDLHFDGLTTTRTRLDELVAQINSLQPDLIVFTGDFVSGGMDFCQDELIAALRALRARDGVAAVMGNHDHFKHTIRIRRVIRESGLIDLNNAVHSLRRGDAYLHLAGVDSTKRHHDRLKQVLRALPASGVAILLAHEPEYADVSVATGRFALQLSGHTHGGQIRLPLLTRLILPRKKTRFMGGLTQLGEMQVYVNRGIGVVTLPLRINCPAELTTITLRALKG